jgi:hypothetical protein
MRAGKHKNLAGNRLSPYISGEFSKSGSNKAKEEKKIVI